MGDPDYLRLVQFDVDGTTVIAERTYEADMYIRGQWYLVGSVADESGIANIRVTNLATSAELANRADNVNADWFTAAAVPDGSTNITAPYYTLRIPLGFPTTSSVAGSHSYQIEVSDSSDPVGVTRQTIAVNYDNIAPVVGTIVNSQSKPVSTTNQITQSNNTYTIGSVVTEENSGFERLAFFFVRRGNAGNGTVDRVYNPMLSAGARTDLSALTFTAGDLPRITYAGATRADDNSLTHASIGANANIRVGGLVRIAGVDRRIASVSGNTITFSPAVSNSFTTAEFAYAQIVDNTTAETGDWSGGPTPVIAKDDGDGMVEVVERNVSTYNWQASINSLNIPDGPIELHYVAYDKGGNATAGSISTYVSNKRPQIAKVRLGTDLSGDNAFSSTELITYYTAVSGQETSLVNLKSSAFKVKGRLAVVPEFVGGNGTIRYLWETNAPAGTAWDGTIIDYFRFNRS